MNKIPPISRLASRAGRLINRHIFGLQPDPTFWPPPPDCASLQVPPGINADDEAGSAWILDLEHMPAWHRRRTVIGVQACRFERNEEYDCGWRLADVAARFLQFRSGGNDPTLLTIVPPPPVYSPVDILPWLGIRLAQFLGARFIPDLFEAAAPFPVHPDSSPQPRPPLSSLFKLRRDIGLDLEGERILLIDWRYRQGRTLSTLARLLRRSHAEVVRFTWLR